MIWLMLIAIIICASVLIAMYLYYANENMTGCFAKKHYYEDNDKVLQELKEQQQQLVNEIQELKTIIKEQSSFGGFKVL